MTEKRDFEPMEEVISSRQAATPDMLELNNYYGQTIWDGEKLITPHEWEIREKRGVY